MKVCLSSRAYASIIYECEEYFQDNLETGGVFLGLIENDTYYILEMIPPGYNSIHYENSFQYDKEYLEYTSSRIAYIYKKKLKIIGIWHTHWNAPPVFSPPDIIMNQKFVELCKGNIISAIVFNEGEKFNIVGYEVDSLIVANSIPISIGDNEILENILYNV